jgi:hypothetical protein
MSKISAWAISRNGHTALEAILLSGEPVRGKGKRDVCGTSRFFILGAGR